MKRFLCLVALSFLICGGTAQAKNTSGVEFGGEIFLVKEKAIAGLDINVLFSRSFGFNFEAALAFASDGAERKGIDEDSSFLGFLLGPHLFFNQPINPMADARIGFGLDAWPLSGINKDEAKFAMPIYAEANLAVTPKMRAFVRARFYLFKSDGLGLGEEYDGDTQIPLLLSVGLSTGGGR